MTNKRCPACEETKPITEFGKDKRAKNGIAVYCRPCNRVKSQKQRDRNPNLNRSNHLRYRYNLTIQEYDEMKAAQDGKCACCKKEDSRLVIDHDHTTGKIRGLLCDACNLSLGLLGDDLSVISSLHTYLENNV